MCSFCVQSTKTSLVDVTLANSGCPPMLKPPTLHTFPSAHLHVTPTEPSLSFPQKRTSEASEDCCFDCLFACNFNSCLWWKTHLCSSVSPDTHQRSCYSTRSRLFIFHWGPSASMAWCSTSYFRSNLQQHPTAAAVTCSKKKKNLWVFLPDTHTLNLMVPPFWHFRLHRSPDEQTTGGKKNDRCMFTAPFVQVGWFGDCEASDHGP